MPFSDLILAGLAILLEGFILIFAKVFISKYFEIDSDLKRRRTFLMEFYPEKK